MPKPILKIYGERNTGTNYLSELVELNLDVRQINGVEPKGIKTLQEFLPGREIVRDIYFYLTFHRNLGWKHSLAKEPNCLKKYNICSANISFVTITKNPYSWLLSLYRRPYQHHWRRRPDFETFLKSPWPRLGRDNARHEFSSPVELWNLKNASYIKLKDAFRTLNIKYEDLLSHPMQIIEKISESFGYEWKRSEFANYVNSTKKKDGMKDFSFYQKYYLDEEWKKNLTAKSMEIINEKLDVEVLKYFEYEKLE